MGPFQIINLAFSIRGASSNTVSGPMSAMRSPDATSFGAFVNMPPSISSTTTSAGARRRGWLATDSSGACSETRDLPTGNPRAFKISKTRHDKLD